MKKLTPSFRAWALLGLALAVWAPGVASNAAQCQLSVIAELPVTVTGKLLLAQVTINGHDGAMILDTGASTSLLFRQGIDRFGLKEMRRGWGGARLSGVGGETEVGVAIMDSFTLGQSTVRNMRIDVAGEGRMGGGKVVGLLGEDFLSQFDLEIDLAHQAVRLLRPVHCQGDQVAYWAQAYSKAPIELEPDGHIDVEVLLNGKPINAFLDTGASTSVVTLAAAANAGVTPSSPGVEKGGMSVGIGAVPEPEWTAAFATFSIGDETIRNAKIKMSNIFSHATHMETGSMVPHADINQAEMLLGLDFCRAHRLMIARGQNMIYFTYNGGPVFDVASHPPQAAATVPPDGTPKRTTAAAAP